MSIWMQVYSAAETNEILCGYESGYVLLTDAQSFSLGQCEDPEFFYLGLLLLIHHLKNAVQSDICQK